MASSINGQLNYAPGNLPYDVSIASFDSSLKRRRSEEDAGYKRQRIDSGSGPEPDLYAVGVSHSQPGNQLTANSGHSSYYNQGQNSSTLQYGTATVAEVGGFWDPHRTMRINSLEILNNLSTQILATLAQGPWAETIRIITEPERELGQAYSTLKSLFDQTKKMYAQQDAFLSADELHLMETDEREIIRTTNLATFVSGVFAGDVGFYDLNDHFIETFTRNDESLSKEHGQLFLNLKTQVYLSALSQEEQERTQEEILYEMFPDDIELVLLSRNREVPLSKAEHEFVEGMKKRREYLLTEATDVESIQILSNKYAWEDFLKSLSEHLSKAYGPLIAPYMKRHAPAPQDQRSTSSDHVGLKNAPTSFNGDFCIHSFAEEAEREVQRALQSFIDQSQSTTENGPSNTRVSIEDYPATIYAGTTIPVPPSQSAPTQVLYEKARQSVIAKSNPGSARRPALPSQRRPWSQEEEHALMMGLDVVKGPHWSQILNLYGPEGSVNQVLKERNQVQLKDKARNLKLFFLKSNTEVPHYLRTVTGELKTRAPSQAAKREAEERARQGSTEERLRVDGIMALSSIRDQTQISGQDDDDYGSMSQTSEVTLVSPSDAHIPEKLDVVETETGSLHPLSADE